MKERNWDYNIRLSEITFDYLLKDNPDKFFGRLKSISDYDRFVRIAHYLKTNGVLENTYLLNFI